MSIAAIEPRPAYHLRPAQWLQLVAIAAAMLAGILVAFLAWRRASTPMATSAALLLHIGPALAVLVTTAGPASRVPPADTLPNLFATLRAAENTLRLIRVARSIAFVGASYVLVLWFCELSGLRGARSFVLAYTLIVVAALCTFQPWLGRVEQRVREDRDRCARQLKELKLDRGWSGS